MTRSRLLRRVKLWVFVACVVGVGFTSSPALAEEPPPPTEPTPTVPEPPPVTASGPVVTVSSPPTPAPVPKPDPTPVQRKPAPAKKSAPTRRPAAPAPKPAATQAPARAVNQPATPTPASPAVQPASQTPIAPATPRPSTRPRARSAEPAAPLGAAKLPRAAQKKKPARAAAASAKARKSPSSTSPLEALARDLPSVPPVSAVERRAAPSGAEQAATSLRWLFVALLGTAAVFITAVGSRRVFDHRVRVRLASGDGPLVARKVLPPPQPATAPVPTAQNGDHGPEPEPVVAKPAPRETAPAGMCEIGWSRGYFKSDFYVAAPEPEGGVSEVARSPAFRWTAAGEPPQDEAIAAAHAVLVERLVAMGWEEVGTGTSWYARRYRRRAETESVR